MKFNFFTTLSIFILIFMFFNYASSQIVTDSVTYKIPITICNAGNVSCGTLNFGGYKNGTYCIDDSLGEFELPPAPPSDVFDVRFIDNRTGSGKCMGEGMTLDLRPWLLVETLDTFRIKLQPGGAGYPMTVTWPTGLNAFFNSVEIREVGGTQIVNMLTNTTMTIEEDAVASLRIYTVVKPRGTTSVKDEEGIPDRFLLNQNYPNPFNPSTTFKFSVPVKSDVNIFVFDILGRKVKTLLSENLNPNVYSLEWNGTIEAGLAATSGIYYVRMNAVSENGENYSHTIKVTLIK